MISVIRPSGYVHSSAFAELAETLMYGLKRLGYSASVHENYVSTDYPSIILGWNLLPPNILSELPHNVILYNLEQLHDTSPWLTEESMEIIRNHIIWDYSLSNVKYLTSRGISSVFHVPVGYVPEMTRIRTSADPRIDVLFYGSLNERRKRIIHALQNKGLKVRAAFGVYGKDRDSLIADSKVILNVHFYPTNIFEIVRASYLLSNHKAIVSEISDLTGEEDLRQAIKYCEYEDLVSCCVNLVQNDYARKRLEEQGFTIFSQRDEPKILKEAISTSLS